MSQRHVRYAIGEHCKVITIQAESLAIQFPKTDRKFRKLIGFEIEMFQQFQHFNFIRQFDNLIVCDLKGCQICEKSDFVGRCVKLLRNRFNFFDFAEARLANVSPMPTSAKNRSPWRIGHLVTLVGCFTCLPQWPCCLRVWSTLMI